MIYKLLRIFFILVLVAFSITVLYAPVHEFGHLSVGMLFGAQGAEVVWTIYSGQNPYVSFTYCPVGVIPWMKAAGIVFPTILGLILLGFWLALGKKISWYLRALLVIPGLILLLGNFSQVCEISRDKGHMRMLALHLGLTGIGAVIFTLLPVMITLLAIAIIWYRANKKS